MVIQHSLRGILQTFIMNRNDRRTCPDLCKAAGSMASFAFPPSLPLLSAALAMETRCARGYTDVPWSPPPLHTVCSCVHVCVIVSRPTSLVYP